MKDYLGNPVNVDDTVLIAIRTGKTATLARAFVKDAKLKPQFPDAPPSNMIEVEWSNLHRYWMPARNVVRIPDEMLPEKRKEKLDGTEEAVQPQD